jgi:hypothetical protein
LATLQIYKGLLMSWLRVIGDVHGKYVGNPPLEEGYVSIAKGAEYSLCVGDVGFNYNYLVDNLDSNRHKAIGGNHDNYTAVECTVCKGQKCETCEMRGHWFPLMSPHFLKDFGVLKIPDFEPIFYVRGAWSIDKLYRILNVSWWKDEELTKTQFGRTVVSYHEEKPEFVVTHTCPNSIIPYFFRGNSFGNTIQGSYTEAILNKMYNYHQPKKWIFGHWHIDWRQVVKHPETGKETEFICLKELAYIDFEKNS